MIQSARKLERRSVRGRPDVPCFYEVGQGVTLVMLHGIGSSGASWTGQLLGLSNDYRVLAWDAPGYQKSEPLHESEPAAADYARKLYELLESLGIDTCFLIGHSLGALMAASFAATWPDRLAGVVLADSAQGYARATEELREKKLSSRITDLEELGKVEFARTRGRKLLSNTASDEQVAAVCEIMAQINENGYTQAAKMLATGDLLSDAKKYEGPMLILCGSEDVVTPPADSKRLAAELDAPYRAIDGAGHASYFEKPERFNELIAEFVENNSPSKSRA